MGATKGSDYAGTASIPQATRKIRGSAGADAGAIDANCGTRRTAQNDASPGTKTRRARAHDMCGNVREWCQDWHLRAIGTQTDYRGPDSGDYRVVRGGSWVSEPDFCAMTTATVTVLSILGTSIGFRIVSDKDKRCQTDSIFLAPKSGDCLDAGFFPSQNAPTFAPIKGTRTRRPDPLRAPATTSLAKCEPLATRGQLSSGKREAVTVSGTRSANGFAWRKRSRKRRARRMP
jgi:hypothetical protein